MSCMLTCNDRRGIGLRWRLRHVATYMLNCNDRRCSCCMSKCNDRRGRGLISACLGPSVNACLDLQLVTRPFTQYVVEETDEARAIVIT